MSKLSAKTVFSPLWKRVSPERLLHHQPCQGKREPRWQLRAGPGLHSAGLSPRLEMGSFSKPGLHRAVPKYTAWEPQWSAEEVLARAHLKASSPHPGHPVPFRVLTNSRVTKEANMNIN